MFRSYTLSICTFLFALIILTGCSGPLEKTYNPESFSQDLQELEEPNRTIIRNVFDRYERQSGAEYIAGSETVMLPSLTFGEVLNNYKEFHRDWKNKTLEDVEKIALSAWAKINNPRLLRSNLTYKVTDREEQEPTNYYNSYVVEFEHNFDDPLLLGGLIGLDLMTYDSENEEQHLEMHLSLDIAKKAFEDERDIPDDVEFLKTLGYVFPNEKDTIYLPKYRVPSYVDIQKNLTLDILGFDRIPELTDKFEFALGQEFYDFESIDFLLEYSPEDFRNKIDDRLNKAKKAVEEKLKLEVWPYNNDQINQMIDSTLAQDEIIILLFEDN